MVEEQKGLIAQARQNWQQQWQTYFQQQDAALNSHGQHYLAQKYAKEYGVPVAELLQLASPGEMEREAKVFKLTTENAELKKENAELKKARVPAGGKLAATTPGAAGSGGLRALKSRYAEGEVLSSKELAALFPVQT